jgi:hypothetical protein
VDEPRLKAEIWIKALVRRLEIDFITAMVTHSGDAQAGAIYLKLNDLNDGCQVLSRSYGQDGKRLWAPATGDAPVTEERANDYITKQLKFDEDCWVVEIEDPAGKFDMSTLD